MGLLQHVRSPKVEQMAQLLAVLEHTQDPVAVISLLLRVGDRVGGWWGGGQRLGVGALAGGGIWLAMGASTRARQRRKKAERARAPRRLGSPGLKAAEGRLAG
jgi:hypothetical protein